MNNINEMAIKNVEADIEHGFFFVEFENGKSLQCCLKAQRQTEEELFHNGVIFLNQIEVGNSGFNEGLCADCNEWAVGEDDEWEHIEEFLIEQARSNGVEIVA